MDAASIRQMMIEVGDDMKNIKPVLRRYAVQQLAERRIFGYLAFDGGISIGWCNAGRMDAYAVNDFQFIPDFARKNACGKTMSIVCFAIAPEYRGKGVALALLERVVADAKDAGYAAVEGYTEVQKERVYHDFKGPVRLYEKAGFVKAARVGDKVTMRKML
jgi:GNAT superfamily N-acetyltransferase